MIRYKIFHLCNCEYSKKYTKKSDFIFLVVRIQCFVNTVNSFDEKINDMVNFVSNLFNFPVVFKPYYSLFEFRLRYFSTNHY